MNKAGLTLALVGVSLLSAGAGALELPAGPNRDIVARACGSCHDLDMVYDAAGQTREGWNGTIEEMAGYGMKLSAAERAQILEYLTSFLGPEAKKPR
jgi:mono/diheme cytochrome c family protein